MNKYRRLKLAMGCLLMLGVILVWGLTIKAEVPRNIAYQGCLTDSLGNPVPDGAYNLTFALYADSSGGVPLWSNNAVKSGQLVNVVNGMFTYRIGSVAPLPPEVFNDSLLWLAITVVGSGEGELAPRTRLTSVPFAYRALYADNVPAGGGWSQGAGTVFLTNPSDKVGIGVSDPTENLVIGKNLGSYSGNRIVVGDTTPGSYTGLVAGEDSNNRAWLLWDVDGNFFGFGIRDGGSQYNSVLTMKENRVGIGTNEPMERLVVGKDLGSYAGELIVVGNDAAGKYSGVKLGEDADNCGNMIWSNDNNYLYFTVKQNGVAGDPIYITGGKLSIGDPIPFAAITSRVSGTAILGEDIPGTYGGTGVLGKSSDEAGIGTKGMAMGANGNGILGQAYGSGGYGVRAEAKSNARVAIYAESDFSNGVGIEAHTAAGGLAGKFYGNVGLYSPADNHMIMMLGEGLDYAEGFHASDPNKAEPGAVMSIDPEHPGKLTMSRCGYDTKVAGIVAGANNLGSGVRLGTDGFDLDVALAGRVYCNVEATQQAIQPGDLLTTSSIPGYAMKATDYRRAQGAILGKAMQSLEKGKKGQILVLVTLQ